MADLPKEYGLDVFADQYFVADIVKGVLHTIFFHRYFPSVRPASFTPSSTARSRGEESLHVSLPAILDPPEISATIDSYVAEFVSQLVSPSSSSSSPGLVNGRSKIRLLFLDRRRRKQAVNNGWLGRFAGAAYTTDEEVCWEQWTVHVSIARPKTDLERQKAHKAMETSLLKVATKIVSIVNKDKEHIPPILTNDQNPFPYRILVNPSG